MRARTKKRSRDLTLLGFEGPLATLMRDPSPVGTLRDLLLFVSYDVPTAELTKRTARERAHAHLYAIRVHLRASNSLVQVPPAPEWINPFFVPVEQNRERWDRVMSRTSRGRRG